MIRIANKILGAGFLIFSFGLLVPASTAGQCSATGLFSGNLVPTTSWQTVAVAAGRYYTFLGDPCNTYTFTFCSNGGSAGFDTQITIADNVTGTTYYAYSDDFCGLQSQVTFVPPALATYRIMISQYFCSNSGTGATLAYSMTAPVSNSDFTLNINAVAGSPNCAILTSTATGQRGCAWDVDNTLNFLSNFTQDFIVNLGSSDGGADGIAIVIQNDPSGRCACGDPGGALGAQGIVNSIIFEIDTYINGEDRDDGMPTVLCGGGAEPDHLDIWLNGSINPPGGACPGSPGARIIPAAVELTNGGLPYNIENGSDHLMRLSWNAGTTTLTASLMNLAATITYGTVAYSFSPMAVFGTNTPFFGGTGATGALTNQQSFCLGSVLAEGEITLIVHQAENAAWLDWQSSAGSELKNFSIEKSIDGIHWVQLGKKENAEGMAFQWKDSKGPEKLVWYRIAQILQNGQQLLSQVREIQWKIENEFEIFPNPANQSGNFIIRMNAVEETQYFISMKEVTGKEVFFHTISGIGLIGGMQLNCNQMNISPGIYFVEISGGNTLQSKKLMVR